MIVTPVSPVKLSAAAVASPSIGDHSISQGQPYNNMHVLEHTLFTLYSLMLPVIPGELR